MLDSSKACYSVREAYQYVPSAKVCQCVLSVRECKSNTRTRSKFMEMNE